MVRHLLPQNTFENWMSRLIPSLAYSRTKCIYKSMNWCNMTPNVFISFMRTRRNQRIVNFVFFLTENASAYWILDNVQHSSLLLFSQIECGSNAFCRNIGDAKRRPIGTCAQMAVHRKVHGPKRSCTEASVHRIQTRSNVLQRISYTETPASSLWEL